MWHILKNVKPNTKFVTNFWRSTTSRDIGLWPSQKQKIIISIVSITTNKVLLFLYILIGFLNFLYICFFWDPLT